MTDAPLRRQHTGCAEVRAALDAGLPLRLVLLLRGDHGPRVRRLVDRLTAAGVPVRLTSANDLRRMRSGFRACVMLGLSGPDPAAAPESWLARRGAPAWLLSGISYPGNAGYGIRCAEVSGAAGVVLDCAFEGSARRAALRASMYANRFMPVLWTTTSEACDLARRAGRRIVVLEDCGKKTLWESELQPHSLFVVGAEERGVARGILRRADEVLRLPMHGFIPSYNLQAAMAMLMGELLRRGDPRLRRPR